MTKPRLCGIYCIENLVNNKKYIGKSVNIYVKWYDHTFFLKHNNHFNDHLQRSYNKYGKKSFIKYIIELCDESELNSLEEYYIYCLNTDNSDFGYNLSEGGDGMCGMNRPKEWGEHISQGKKGAVFSEEHKLNLSISHRGYSPPESQRKNLQLSIVGKKKNLTQREPSSQYVGVRKKDNRWAACIMVNRKQIWLGSYIDEIDAAKAYDDKSWELYHNINIRNLKDRYDDSYSEDCKNE